MLRVALLDARLHALEALPIGHIPSACRSISVGVVAQAPDSHEWGASAQGRSARGKCFSRRWEETGDVETTVRGFPCRSAGT